MKIRHSVIYLSAFRIPHSAFICFFLLTAISLIFVLSIGDSWAGDGVTVHPIEEAALDRLINNKNDTLIVCFMAAWCGPCIDELPAINNLYRKYRDQGLNVIGISIDLEGAVAMQPVLNKLKIEFPVYWFGEKAIPKFKITAIPLLLIVKYGEIAERIRGRRPDEFLHRKFKEILNQ